MTWYCERAGERARTRLFCLLTLIDFSVKVSLHAHTHTCDISHFPKAIRIPNVCVEQVSIERFFSLLVCVSYMFIAYTLTLSMSSITFVRKFLSIEFSAENHISITKHRTSPTICDVFFFIFICNKSDSVVYVWR